jgi:hypothetical protein
MPTAAPRPAAPAAPRPWRAVSGNESCAALDIAALPHSCARPTMTLTTILLIVLVLVLIGALPTWPYSASWGYAPSGVLSLLLVILLIVWLLGPV